MGAWRAVGSKQSAEGGPQHLATGAKGSHGGGAGEAESTERLAAIHPSTCNGTCCPLARIGPRAYSRPSANHNIYIPAPAAGHLQTACCLLPSTYCFLPTAFCLLLDAKAYT